MPRKIQKQEESLQIALSNYIKLQYPKVVFTSESSGIRVSMGTAIKMKKQRSVHTHLDMFIAEPRGGYHGLFIELKKHKDEVYSKRDGSYLNNKHIKDQRETIEILLEKGYDAVFGCGFDECKIIVDNYMAISI